MASPAVELDMTAICQLTQAWLKQQTDQVDEENQPKFSDVPSMLEHVLQVANGDVLTKQLVANLKELEVQCLKAVKAKEAVKKAPMQATVPADPQVEVESEGEAASAKFPLRVWQMGFRESYSFKGASSLYAVVEVIKTNLLGAQGNQTLKYPIEVLFDCGQARPPAGSPIRDFSVGTANGFAVVLGSLVCSMVAAQLGWMKPDSRLSADLRSQLGGRLLKCLRLHGTYSPKGDMRSQAQSILSTKIQASNRSRPTTLQMLYAFQRVVTAEVDAGTRKARGTLLQEALAAYNQREQLRSLKINADELTAIKFLNDRSPAFRKLLTVVWGVERPANTAAPMNLLSSEWLQEAAPNPVSEP